jgi:hypothetical protein
MQRNDPSQFVGQLQDQVYPIIESLTREKQQSVSSVRGKRNINKAISYFENGLDLVEKAFMRGWDKKKKSDIQNGSRSSQRTQSYHRQTSEVS